MPVVCNEAGTLCLYIENGVLVGRLGSAVTTGTTTIPAQTWTLLILRYDHEGEQWHVLIK